METNVNDLEILPASAMPIRGNSVLLKAIKELKKRDCEWCVRVRIIDGKLNYMRSHAHTYAGRAGIAIETVSEDGYLWIKRMHFSPRDYGTDKGNTTQGILRSLGR